MNQLSWLIYLADVAGSVDGVSLALMITGVPAGVAAFLRCDDADRKRWDERERDHRCYPTLYPNPPAGERPDTGFPLRKYGARLLVLTTVSGLLFALTPTKETVYAIAASEMGEKALQSPTATKAMKALDAWLDRQIAKPVEAAQ